MAVELSIPTTSNITSVNIIITCNYKQIRGDLKTSMALHEIGFMGRLAAALFNIISPKHGLLPITVDKCGLLKNACQRI